MHLAFQTDAKGSVGDVRVEGLSFMTYSFIDLAVCVACLAVVLLIGWASARGQHSNEEFFVGGRRMNWWAVGISMFATSFSSISFLGLPQRGAYQDFSFYLTILMIPLVITPILWFIFVPLYVRLKVSSGYEYLGRRFGIPTQLIGATLYSSYAIGWMGTMLYAVALTLRTVMGLDDTQYVLALIAVGTFATIYAALGGLRAAVWTEVLLAVVLCSSIIIVFFLTIGRINGGWAAYWDIANQYHKFQLIHLDSNLLAPSNFTAKNSAFTSIAFGLFLYLPGYAVSQNMIQRYVCGGSVAAGRGVVLLSAAINTVVGLLFLCVGAAIFVFYSQPGGPGLPAVGREIATEDQILPFFVATHFPGIGLVGLVVAGLLSAALSSLISDINGVSSAIVFDWLRGKQPSLFASRVLTVAVGIVVMSVALIVPLLSDTVFGIMTTISGTFLGILLAIFLLGLFVRRANQPGVLIGLFAGFASLLAVRTLTDVPHWWSGAFAIIPTFVVGATASMWFDAPPAAIWIRKLDSSSETRG